MANQHSFFVYFFLILMGPSAFADLGTITTLQTCRGPEVEVLLQDMGEGELRLLLQRTRRPDAISFMFCQRSETPESFTLKCGGGGLIGDVKFEMTSDRLTADLKTDSYRFRSAKNLICTPPPPDLEDQYPSSFDFGA